jgi:hypothetical protein
MLAQLEEQLLVPQRLLLSGRGLDSLPIRDGAGQLADHLNPEMNHRRNAGGCHLRVPR